MPSKSIYNNSSQVHEVSHTTCTATHNQQAEAQGYMFRDSHQLQSYTAQSAQVNMSQCIILHAYSCTHPSFDHASGVRIVFTDSSIVVQLTLASHKCTHAYAHACPCIHNSMYVAIYI